VKVRIFNVKFSENLGDGIISDCFEYLISKCSGDNQVDITDLSRKHNHENFKASLEEGGERLGVKNRMLSHISTLPFGHVVISALNLIYSLLLVRDLRKARRADLVFIGGGQLISGADFFFPGRLLAPYLYVTRVWKTKVVFYSVGVAPHFNKMSLLFFKFMISRARVFTRDVISTKRIQNVFRSDAVLVSDVGIIASKVYGPAFATREGVGFCVSSPDALKVHSAAAGVGYDVDFYVDKIEMLLDSGFSVRLFTNGLALDHRFMILVYETFKENKGENYLLSFEGRFSLPSDLAEFISSCEFIFAHRMHACIVATSYGVPAFGFGWDDKLESFYAAAGIDDLFIPYEESHAVSPCALIQSVDCIKHEIHSKLLVEQAYREHIQQLDKVFSS
jgi:polysaccharide pyruvyl transferase WcaK-like protein